MDSRLLIEATPALLSGWAGPVVFTRGGGTPGVVVGTTRLGSTGEWVPLVWWLPDDDGLGEAKPSHVSSLSLDLSRAECRDRVARAAAPHVFGDILASDILLTACMVPGRTIGPLVMGMSITTVHEGERWRHVEACADLDPLDETRLHDGSRRVDALALLHVARTVLGVTCG